MTWEETNNVVFGPLVPGFRWGVCCSMWNPHYENCKEGTRNKPYCQIATMPPPTLFRTAGFHAIRAMKSMTGDPETDQAAKRNGGSHTGGHGSTGMPIGVPLDLGGEISIGRNVKLT